MPTPRSVVVFGAGSIGNHLSYACRRRNWKVRLVDVDVEALRRTEFQIYPDRYGHWDPEITLSEEVDWGEHYDLVIVGTPPSSHLEIATLAMARGSPSAVLIEKPLSPPSLAGYREFSEARQTSGSEVLVGYNHNLTENTNMVVGMIRQGAIGAVRSIEVRWLEHWGGIFAAHPWLSGPKDSYLGSWVAGGGASLEHSHGVSLWNLVAKESGAGKVIEVGASINYLKDLDLNYDETCVIDLKTENGVHGSVTQDVITRPPEKFLRVQGDKGTIEWRACVGGEFDEVVLKPLNQDASVKKIPWTRPGDFEPEIAHIARRLEGDRNASPISLENGYETMRIIQAAHLAHSDKTKIDPRDMRTDSKLFSN